MKEETIIVYQDYIPDKLIGDFKALGLDKVFDIDISTKKEVEKYSYFTGYEIVDIVIYIQQHTTELIVSGLLVNSAYDLLKGGLKLLWVGLSKLSINKLQSDGKETGKPKSISVRLVNEDRTVEFVLEGDINEEQADKIIDESFKFISSTRLNDAFQNPDFLLTTEDKPCIRLIHNKEKHVWEPEDFGKYRKQMNEFQKWIEKDFDN